MINHTSAYTEAVTADSRRQYVRAVFDLIDPDAQITGVQVSDACSSLSVTGEVTDRGTEEGEEVSASLEWNRWVLDGSISVAPNSPSAQTSQIGWVSNALSGADGVFSEPPYIEVTVSGVQILQAVTFLFSSQQSNGIPADFTVQIFSGSTMLYQRAVTGNDNSLLVLDAFTVNYPTRVRLTITKWSEGYRRARVPRFMLGLYEVWDNSVIQSVDIYTEVTFSGLSLPFSTCSMTVFNAGHRFDPYAQNAIFASVEDRQSISVELGMRLADGTIEWLPGGTYYQQSAGWSLQDLTVTWELLDVIGALTKRRFVVPETLPTSVSGWLGAIVGSLGTNFSDRYIVDAEIADTSLTVVNRDAVAGKTCGELLRFLCMAVNAWPRQDFPTGKLRVGKLKSTEGNRITLGNMCKYPLMSANDDISDITFALDSGEVTFPGNNTDSEVSLQVNNPFVHTSSDARKAVISCLFEYGGKSFEVIHRGNPTSEVGDIQRVDTQFLSTISARLYKQQLALKNGVMTQMPSYLVQSPNDSTYENKIVLTGAGTWAAETAGTVKATLIGGGSGGQGGGGGNMLDGDQFDPEDTDGGAGGNGGKVFITEFTAVSGQSYAFSCGSGGNGGAGGYGRRSTHGEDGSPGTDGGDTTFGVFSSGGGTRYAVGIMDIQSGAVYAQKGGDYGDTVSGLYGSGGAGGEQGRNGTRAKALGDNGIYYTYIAKYATSGENGLNGLPGCVILEW